MKVYKESKCFPLWKMTVEKDNIPLTLPFRGDDRILLVKIVQGGFLYE